MNTASCLCGAVKLQIDAEPVKVSHCHCKMCQKQHGAAYATYARFKRADVDYLQGQDKLTIYNSSEDILRKFCGICGSNIEWGCSERFPQWVAIALASFDNEPVLPEILELHAESKVCWLSKS